MTTGLCSVHSVPSRYELAGTEPCRDATWSEVPESVNLSSCPGGVAAVMAYLALVPGGAGCETLMKASFPKAWEVAALPVLHTCGLLDLASGGLPQLRRGTTNTCNAVD